MSISSPWAYAWRATVHERATEQDEEQRAPRGVQSSLGVMFLPMVPAGCIEAIVRSVCTTIQ